jgi:hypothetical protein
MAIYTTFFLCRPEDLPVGFPGWRLPLVLPVRREFRNPFTGEVAVVETRLPEWPDGADDEQESAHQIVEFAGGYEDYLVRRLQPFVGSCPHWAAKGLTEVELKPLLEAVGVAASMEYAIYAPPSSGSFAQQMPAEFLVRLVSIDLKGVAEKWATVMSSPEHTHSVTGVKLSDGWTEYEALEILRPLVALAQLAKPGQLFYLLTEF